MNKHLRQMIWERARGRCEYCLLRQEHEPFIPLQLEHIIAKQHQGGDEPENLALACLLCNSHKGSNLTGLDPDTGQVTRLFHPRRDAWHSHFRRDGALIIGCTDVGRTTVWLLQMNDVERIELRHFLLESGELL
ncbi:MAG TPA: hypothetical protein DDZ88_07870 [Verrucomicrobiales bacterium]|nr:hypothetical protein [Verrucomicrobiales bacterium]